MSDDLAERMREVAAAYRPPQDALTSTIRRGTRRRRVRRAGTILVALLIALLPISVVWRLLDSPSSSPDRKTPASDGESPPGFRSEGGHLFPVATVEDGIVTMPVVFPSGQRGELSGPESLGLDRFGIWTISYFQTGECVAFSRASMNRGSLTDGPPLETYSGLVGEVDLVQATDEDPVERYLLFPIGDWVLGASIDSGTCGDASAIEALVQGIDGHQTPEGYLVVTPLPPVELLTDLGSPEVAPSLQFQSSVEDGRTIGLLEAVDCSLYGQGTNPIVVTHSDRSAQWCLPASSIFVEVSGDVSFVDEALEGLKLELSA